MPSRRPPPLSPALFAPQGPLAPGSAPLPPSPNTIHPAYVIDAHCFVADGSAEPTSEGIFLSLPESLPRPPVKSVVQVKLVVSAEPAQAVLGVKPFSIHPTILNLTLAMPPSITNIAKHAMDIIVPAVGALSEKEWDLLEEAVSALEGTDGGQQAGGRIVISGLLPPPLTRPSNGLPADDAYNLYLARTAALSLHPNVHLKVLPPVVDVSAQKEGKWWDSQRELERVMRAYLSPTIEAFGTHRLIFGSFSALPLEELAKTSTAPTSLEQPISSKEWYTVLRKVVASLGEGEEAMSGIMGANAARVYQLE